MCESKTSPDWLWLVRGHLMHSVNIGTLRMNPGFNQPRSGVVGGGAVPKALALGEPVFKFAPKGEIVANCRWSNQRGGH